MGEVKMLSRARALFNILVLTAVVLLGGCGTYVPNIAEGSGKGLDILLENAIIQSIHCELRNAVVATLAEDKLSEKPFADFLYDWAVQATLTLTIEEKSTVAPTIGMSFPPGF